MVNIEDIIEYMCMHMDDESPQVCSPYDVRSNRSTYITGTVSAQYPWPTQGNHIKTSSSTVLVLSVQSIQIVMGECN